MWLLVPHEWLKPFLKIIDIIESLTRSFLELWIHIDWAKTDNHRGLTIEGTPIWNNQNIIFEVWWGNYLQNMLSIIPPTLDT